VGVVLGIFLFGCLVTATVVLGLLFAISASVSVDGFEGKGADDKID
jgi:hypothetical protein